MSQQNANDENQMEVVEPNQNQVAVAVAGAILPNGAPQPEVFKLDIDCWDEVFDCLSLKDVHSFGQTCKAFQRVAGKYFQWKYEAVLVDWRENVATIGSYRVDGFIEFAQKIQFSSIPSSVGSNFESIKLVRFIDVDLHQLKMNSMNLLSKVEHLEISCCSLDESILGALIESCINLKRLEFLIDSPFTWPIQEHPTLQHLSLNITFGNVRLTNFLENSPSVKSLQINAELLWKYRDSILNSNVKLDDLAVEWNTSYFNVDIFVLLTDLHRRDLIFVLLTDLHRRDFYRRLHLRSCEVPSPDQLLALQGLVALFVPSVEIMTLPPLVNIREIGIYNQWNTQRSNGANAIALAGRLVNLERLFIGRANFDEILPFIRGSIKLKYVKIDEFGGKILDILALNKERKRLEGARKVTIYVDEDVYLATKWAKTETSTDLIEIERKESHNMVCPHDFWKSYRKPHLHWDLN